MINVLSCLTLEHDLRLVLLAVLICVLGTGTFLQLIKRAFATNGMVRMAWIAVSSIAVSTTIWCAHFISMLAYITSAPVALDPALTMLSLILPVFGFFLANILLTLPGRHLPKILGGGLIGICIGGLHYLGMYAYHIDGIISWDVSYIIASVIGACCLTIAACYTFETDWKSRFSILTVSLFSMGVVVLHFTGMAAMTVVPLQLSANAMEPGTFIALSLATAIGGLLIIATGGFFFFLDLDTRREGYEKLLHMAKTDMMTGLPNRVAFIEDLEEKLRIAKASDRKMAMIGVDLNRFKDINDTYGHKAGDEVLKIIASRFLEDLDRSEFIARLGGDEFAAAKLYREPEELERFLNHLSQSVNQKIEFETAVLVAGGSIGVAIFPDDGMTTDDLRNNADLAMYRAKLNPLRNICFYESSMDEEVRQKRELARDLAKALEDDQLVLHYQPQASTVTGQLSGVEALLRWTHPQKGPISPGIFIPIAEESGLIIALGEWVLRRACQDASEWVDAEKVAVNMSALQLNQTELPQIIHQILLETGLSPRRLEIELTETAILEDRQQSLHVLRQIKALGVRVALDDFGTGYSSLEILRSFPFDKIKLDRFFMAEIETSIEAKALVRSVLSLGKSLSIPILAEGVETEMQLSILREEGCDEIQGFLLGRPEQLQHAITRSLELTTLSQPGSDSDLTEKARKSA